MRFGHDGPPGGPTRLTRMDRITRVLASLTLAAAVGVGLTACADDGPDRAGGTAAPVTTGLAAATTTATTTTATTTSSTPVPGPADSPVDVPVAVADRWAGLGGEQSGPGRATGPATAVAGGSVTDFERASIVLTPAGRAFVVQGEILAAYRESGGPEGDLGFPTSDEATTDGGWISTFDGGIITHIDGATEIEVR